MNERAVPFDWNRARAFLATAEAGSYSKAAQALNLTQPTLGRQVAALEQELGVTLFERVGRGITLTSSGLALLQHVKEMGEAAERLALAAQGRSETLQGSVSVTATEVFAAHVMPPVLTALRTLHPGIQVELLASNTISDLRRREADIAIRGIRPEHPDLVARKVGQSAGGLYASPDYLKRFGTVTTPADLAGADYLGFERSPALAGSLQPLGFEVSAKDYPIQTDSHLVHWALVRAGLGIGMNEISIGDADPGVVRVLPAFAHFPLELWLVTHRELRTSRRIRAVFDAIAAELTERFQ